MHIVNYTTQFGVKLFHSLYILLLNLGTTSA
jgi:hypothetical protein